MQTISSRHSRVLPLIAAAALSLAGCVHPSQTAGDTTTATAGQGTDTPPTGRGGGATTAIRARYEGVLPCADCSGIQTELMLLANGSYVVRETYQGKSTEALESAGRYNLTSGTQADPNAVVYQLTPEEGEGVRYFVAVDDGHELRLLDKNKQELPSRASHTLKLTGGAPVQP